MELSFNEMVELALTIDERAEVHVTDTIPAYYVIYTSYQWDGDKNDAKV
jgi:hypothetical protein